MIKGALACDADNNLKHYVYMCEVKDSAQRPTRQAQDEVKITENEIWVSGSSQQNITEQNSREVLRLVAVPEKTKERLDDTYKHRH
jgi:hypothetical protein